MHFFSLAFMYLTEMCKFWGDCVIMQGWRCYWS